MKRAENKVSDFLKSRAGTALMVLIGLAGALLAYGRPLPELLPEASGFIFESPDRWFAGTPARFCAGLALSVAVGVMMAAVNSTFNILRTSSPLFLGVFAVMQGATPLIVNGFTASVMLNVVLLGVLATFYTVYLRPRQTRRIFLAFCVMSAGALTSYVYALYALLFLLAFQQMRCPSTRMYLAALMGLVTPWWICLGFGWTGAEGIHWPDRVTIFTAFDKTSLIMMLVTVGVTVICSFLICCTNMVRIYSYNAKARALSGLLTMLTLFTATASLVDIANAPAYLSTLNCLTAFQVGLFFRIVESRRGYVYILSLTAAYIIIYFCNLWL